MQSSQSLKKPEECKIVIIGAGIAGLAAASHLQKYGFRDISVLEARKRIGGRTHTVLHDSCYIEMGAQWIHGERGNSVYEFAKELNLLSEDAPDYKVSLLQCDEWDEDKKKELEEIFALLFEAEEECSMLTEDMESKLFVTRSFGSYLYHKFVKNIGETDDSSTLHQLKLASYDWFVRLQKELIGTNSLSDVSAFLFGCYKECEGRMQVELKNGYHDVLNVVLKNIESSWIYKEHVVRCIIWDKICKSSFESSLQTDNSALGIKPSYEGKNLPRYPIQVQCENGSIFDADHVIITLPLGCLKSCASSMFEPPLPLKKLEAIQCLGFGAVGKIYLEYEEPFWESNRIFKVLWLDGYDHEGNSYLDDSITKVKGPPLPSQHISNTWMRAINRFSYVHNQPNLMCAWIAGDAVPYMESLPEEEVIKGCHQVLKYTLNNADIPLPKKIIRTCWATDPYSQGSYTYISVACEKNGVLPSDLAEPVSCLLKDENKECPLLLFAGEATHPHYFSTVHGAYDSGTREANRLATLYRMEILKNQSHLHLSRQHVTRQIKKQDQAERQQYYNTSSTLDSKTLPTASTVFQNQCCKYPDHHPSYSSFVIIGAGVAGLACAQRLASNGFSNIVILEAQEYPGGRVRTVPHAGGVLEMGAQWVHGEEDNPLFEFSSSKDLLADPKVHSSVEGKGHFCTDKGEDLREKLVEEVIMVLDNIKEEISSDENLLALSKDVPQLVGTLYKEKFASYLSSCIDDDNVCKIKKGIFDWYMRFEVIDNACYNLDEISAQGYADWVECEGNFHINFKYGFKSFLDSLLLDIPKDSLRLKTIAKCVHWKERINTKREFFRLAGENFDMMYPTAVECDDGEIIYADHVILTPSIGYLRTHCESLFNPKLPGRKKKVIQTLGFGTINKIYLVFKESFWTNQDLGFQLIWTDTDYESFPEWTRGISGFDVVNGQPNVLVGWIGGHYAIQMEEMLEEDVGRTCTDLLRKFLNKDVPYPVQVFRSQWHSNPFVLGSYSSHTVAFQKVGGRISDLTDPVYCSWSAENGTVIQWPTILFAGEATDEKFFSSAHGALCSGWREADRLVAFYQHLQDMADRRQVTTVSHPKL